MRGYMESGLAFIIIATVAVIIFIFIVKYIFVIIFTLVKLVVFAVLFVVIINYLPEIIDILKSISIQNL